MALNAKQARFVAEYLVDLNATQAAIRAGYSARSAYSQGERLLRHAEIRKAVAAGKKRQADRLELTAMRVLEDIHRIGTKAEKVSDFGPALKARELLGKHLKLFTEKLDPDTREPLRDPGNYVAFQMNPKDNAANLSPEYLETLEGLGERMKRRFVRGEFAEATPNALFDEATIDRWRTDGDQLPDFVRIVVAVDPSGASDDEVNADNDEVGITVDALGTDGRAYLLEDLTVSGGPKVWGKVAVQAYLRHGADVLVGEKNFGGGMVKLTVQVAAAALETRVNFKMVTASRGKIQRAEPFSALYDDGKVRHAGIFPKLEDELCAFSTGGYTGPRSPNRADAHVWGLAELFPAIVSDRQKRKPYKPPEVPRNWMAA